MPKFYHSPARTAIRGGTHLLTVAAEPSVASVSAVVAGAKTSFIPVETCAGLTVWQGRIPADAETLAYTLYADAEPVGSYTVPTAPLSLAPIAITEVALNLKGIATPYLEVANTTDSPIDLAAYAIAYRAHADEELSGSVAIADRPGDAVLPPHSVSVLWLAFAENHSGKTLAETPADFCARLENAFAWRNYHLAPEEINLIRVECAEPVAEVDGTMLWREKEGIPALPRPRPWDRIELGIVPLGGELEQAVCRVALNDCVPDEWAWHTPVYRASLWSADSFGGADMVCLARAADLTPGSLTDGQTVADPTRDVPVCLIPLDWPTEHPLADGDLTLRVSAVGAGSVTLTLDGHRLTAPVRDGEAAFTLPADLLGRVEAFTGTLEADGGTYRTVLPLPALRLIDNAGPVVTAIAPEDGYAAIEGEKVTVNIRYFDRAGVDAHASHLYLDGKEISALTRWTAEGVTCTLESLKPGTHKLALKLYDCLGNPSRTVTHFSVVEAGLMRCYRGEVHCHTGDSDGVGTPENAIVYARDVGEADYFAVTDHGHYLTDESYADQHAVADRYNAPGQYAVLRGWEMTWNNTCGYWGHINVLETADVHYDIRDLTMPELFDFIAARPGAIGMFNHPGYAWGNFDEYGHLTPTADAAMYLNEIRGVHHDEEHAHALARGWHLGPVSNEDNHAYNWTTAGTQTGYVLVPALSRQNVLEAFRAHRTYTTSDPSLHLRFRINGAWLGSRIPATDMLTVDMRIDTEKPEGLGVLRLVGEDNITVASWDLGAAQHFEQRIHIPADFDYYYLKLQNPLVPKSYTISAPVWVEGRDALTVTDMTLSLTGGSMASLVSIAAENSADAPITDLRADFYLTPTAGFDLATARPYATAYLGKLAAGETARTARTLPNLPGRRRVSVIVSGKLGKRRFVDTRFLILTPASIVEVLPESKPVDGKQQPFTYAVLFNHENQPLELGGMALRQWTTTGKAPSPAHIHPLDGITIPARMPAVFWFRANPTLTASDFCARYGVDLVEGENLFILEGISLSDSHIAGRRLDLALGGEVLSRVHWNYTTTFGCEPRPDIAYRYGYRGSMTGTAERVDATDAPAPGTLIAAQTPAARMHVTAKPELRRASKADKKARKASRKPAKPEVKRGAAAAMTAGAATAGVAIGAGAAALAILLGQKKK